MESVQIIIFVLSGIAAYRSPFFGIVLLLISSCTFDSMTNYTTMPLPIGSLTLADFAIFGICIKTLRKIKNSEDDIAYKVCLMMISWLVLCSLLVLIGGHTGFREAYRTIFRIAFLWILPITVRELSNLQKHRLITICFMIAGVIAIIQIYASLSGNPMVLEIFYPVNYETAGFKTLGEFYQQFTNIGIVPRLYPPGNILVQMIFAFVLGLVFMGSWNHGKLFSITVLVLSFSFIVSLAGRSNVLSIFVAIIWVFYTLFRISATGSGFNLGKKINLVFQGVFILLFCGGILMNVSDHSLFENIKERWGNTISTGQIDTSATRMDDSIEGWHALMNSPLWGIGRTKLYWEAKFETYGGQDLHPFISQGLIGGIPGILMLFLWIILLFRQFNLVIRTFFEGTSKNYALSSAVALSSVLFLSFINTTPVFLYSSNQVPFGIFCGLLLSRPDDDLNKNSLSTISADNFHYSIDQLKQRGMR